MTPIEASQVEAELAKGPPAERSWGRNFVVLLASLAVFAGTGLLGRSVASLAILVVVLLVHEGGHWVGMRLFGYRDVQMFFIPFFGAAVHGRADGVSAAKKAVVVLLGPVPGIVLGFACQFAGNRLGRPVLEHYGTASLVLNLFNLLPLIPLDGGRLLEILLFSRNRVLEVAFYGLAVVGLGLLAWKFSPLLFGALAFFTLVAAKMNYNDRKAEEAIRRDLPVTADLPETIPPDVLPVMLPHLFVGFERARVTPRFLAVRAQKIWRRLRERPPGWGATAALLAVYGIAWLPGVLVAVVALRGYSGMNGTPHIERHLDPAGRMANFEVVTIAGHKTFEVELADSGLFDGPCTEWTTRGVRLRTGNWSRGLQQGEWLYFARTGDLESVRVFDQGKLTGYSVPRGVEVVVLEPKDWPVKGVGEQRLTPVRAPRALFLGTR